MSLCCLHSDRRLIGRIPASAVLLPLILWAAAVVAQTPLNLFNGTSLLGWSPHGPWAVTGGVLATMGEGERSLLTEVPFGDCKLEFEYNETGPLGAKLRLWSNRENKGGLVIDLDEAGGQAGVGGIESLSHSSLGSLSLGWHRAQVEASHGQVRVRIDGLPYGTASDLGSRAGYIGFEAGGSGGLQLRNTKLLPLNLNDGFNGTDLSGWKSVARGPDAKAGVGHTVEKTITLGIGGGSTKPHEANWSVRGGAIHGESGPGGLENDTLIEDGIFHITASFQGDLKPEDYVSLAVRDASGQLGGGYQIGIGPYAGAIEHVVPHAPSKGASKVEETIVVAGRTIAIWVNGNLTTLHTDTRPEASSTVQGARTGKGAVALLLPRGGEQIDIQRLGMVSLPRTYGLAAKAPLPPPPVQAASTAPAAASPPPPSDAEKALLAQQQASAAKDAKEQANKQKVASLMSQALAATDPQQQMAAYRQVVQIDPSNAAAVQGFKEAQAKVEAQQQAQQQEAATQQTQQQNSETREQQTGASLNKAQNAFLNGHLQEASTALMVAERLSPNNLLVRDLRSRLSSAQAVRSRLFLLGGGVGLLGMLFLVTAWLRRRRQRQHPVLEVTRGLEEGRTFALDKDLVRIGAVAQNGAQRNDIVIQDVEHAISRFHCEVARKNGQLYVTDLKSSNGTRLNGGTLRPGQPELLRKGSTITLANNVDLRFGYERRKKS